MAKEDIEMANRGDDIEKIFANILTKLKLSCIYLSAITILFIDKHDTRYIRKLADTNVRASGFLIIRQFVRTEVNAYLIMDNNWKRRSVETSSEFRFPRGACGEHDAVSAHNIA